MALLILLLDVRISCTLAYIYETREYVVVLELVFSFTEPNSEILNICCLFFIFQLPFLLGVPILEKLAPPLAPIVIGRTGRQLFLTDGKPSKPPLLLRMTSDYEDKKFM